MGTWTGPSGPSACSTHSGTSTFPCSPVQFPPLRPGQFPQVCQSLSYDTLSKICSVSQTLLLMPWNARPVCSLPTFERFTQKLQIRKTIKILPKVIRGMSGLLCPEGVGELSSSAGKCPRFRKRLTLCLHKRHPHSGLSDSPGFPEQKCRRASRNLHLEVEIFSEIFCVKPRGEGKCGREKIENGNSRCKTTEDSSSSRKLECVLLLGLLILSWVQKETGAGSCQATGRTYAACETCGVGARPDSTPLHPCPSPAVRLRWVTAEH